MESLPSSPRSPAIHTPICDSDEEVFFGPVTSKELQKASQLKRRTQYYFPYFAWKPSSSPLAKESDKSAEDDKAGKAQMSTGEKPDPSLSSDSLESQSYATSSEKQEESTKGDYWSALSGDSLYTNSQPSLNEAVMFSKISEDSLETNQTQSVTSKSERYHGMVSHTSPNAHSSYTNISEDSLEESSKHHMNVARIHSGSCELESFGAGVNASSDLSSASVDRPNSNLEKVVCETYSVSENSYKNDSLQCSNSQQACQNNSQVEDGSSTFPPQPLDCMTSTYDVLPEIERNDTYTVDNVSSQTIDLDGPANSNIELPKEVAVDKDGGFLSILSEAALYHASQVKEKNVAQAHGLEDSTSTTQSLEDRFKVFGIDAGELEDQQLSNSIMYITGRESNMPCSETESNTFYTGRNSDVQILLKSAEEHNYQIMGTSSDISTFSSKAPSDLNRCIQNSTISSAGNPLHDSSKENEHHQGTVHLENRNDHETFDQSGCNFRESSEISGICELNSAADYQSDCSVQSLNNEESLHNDSGASSYAGEMNDTLEEYEMMMKYGVDYILGRKGNKKRSEHADNSEGRSDIAPCETKEDYYNISPMQNTGESNSQGHCVRSSPFSHQQNSTTSSAEYLDARDVSPCTKKMGNAQANDRQVLSPLHKQLLLKRTPQKPAPNVPKRTVPKVPSKLPRVASVTPSKILHTPSPLKGKQPSQTPSSDSKVFTKSSARPVTPSSEAKSSLFKKPVTPATTGTRIPKTFTPMHNCPKSNNKVLENIQSPVGAYIHNTPSPVLVTNIKAKMTDRAPFEKEIHAKALWRAGEMKTLIPRPGFAQATNAENLNPNVGCGLPAVKYTKAPCIKLDETTKLPNSRIGEKMTKLLDTPSPQVIKHEGRLRVNCGSPQLAAKMQSMAESFDDSMIDVHSVSGDISTELPWHLELHLRLYDCQEFILCHTILVPTQQSRMYYKQIKLLVQQPLV